MPYRRQDDNRGAIGTLQTEAIGVLEENMALAVRCSKELENYIVDCRTQQVVFQLGARRKSRMMRRGIQSGGRKSEECRVSHKTTGLSHKTSPLFTRARPVVSRKMPSPFTFGCKWLRYRVFGVKEGRHSAFTLWRSRPMVEQRERSGGEG